MSQLKSSYGKGVEVCVSWVPCSNGHIPPRAVYAGGNTYVARARHGDEYIPGKAVEGHTCAYVPYDWKEQSKDEYEVLVDCSITALSHVDQGFEWIPASGGSVPKNALVGGTDNGQLLYVARGEVCGETCVGKVHPANGCAYFPHGGEEKKATDYEVLCFKKRSV